MNSAADFDVRALARGSDVFEDFREMFELEIFRERFPNYDFYAASMYELEDVALSVRLSIRQEAARKVAENVEVLLLLIRAAVIFSKRFDSIANRNLRKILVYEDWLRISRGNIPRNMPDNFKKYITAKYFRNNKDSIDTWSLGSNIMQTPTNRGYFDPLERGLDFEFDAEPVLGAQRYQDFLRTFHKLSTFFKKSIF